MRAVGRPVSGERAQGSAPRWAQGARVLKKRMTPGVPDPRPAERTTPARSTTFGVAASREDAGGGKGAPGKSNLRPSRQD